MLRAIKTTDVLHNLLHDACCARHCHTLHSATIMLSSSLQVHTLMGIHDCSSWTCIAAISACFERWTCCSLHVSWRWSKSCPFSFWLCRFLAGWQFLHRFNLNGPMLPKMVQDSLQVQEKTQRKKAAGQQICQEVRQRECGCQKIRQAQ